MARRESSGLMYPGPHVGDLHTAQASDRPISALEAVRQPALLVSVGGASMSVTSIPRFNPG